MKDLKLYFEKIRKQFPAIKQKINGQDLIYLDSTNTTLKPQVVIDRVNQFYSFENTNVHRGGYTFSQKTTEAFESSRAKVAEFLGAKQQEEIIFVRGTTEGINLVASSWGQVHVRAGDEILLTEMEHHANIVPWQMLAEKSSAKIQVARIHDNGELDLEDFKKKLTSKTKIVAVTACSNTLGTINPIEKLTEWAHQVGALILVDGAQLVSQKKVEVAKWNVDFFVFSSHKLFGPTGVGVLYGKKEILEKMPPYQGGGSMISQVTFDKTTYNEIPFRFEAGTPHIEGVIALKTAIEFVEGVGLSAIHDWEQILLNEATARLSKISGLKIYGQAPNKAPIISFNLEGAHHSDVAQILDQHAVCVRSGHHCTQPLMKRYNIPGTVRVSFSVYNNLSEIDTLEKAVIKAKEMLT